MSVYSFKNDYSEGAAPEVLAALNRLGGTQFAGYGEDDLTVRAVETLRAEMQAPEVDIHFVSGGTQANLTALSWMMRPTGAVIATGAGHITVHEAGAIEATGHKIVTCPHDNGKIRVADLRAIWDTHQHEHMTTPEVVYVSQSTELGTVYSHAELATISDFCREKGLYFFIDGARLAQALTCESADVSLADIAKFADAFYMGGTKNGALFGEALVLNHPTLKRGFRGAMKQRGALLAKGFVISAQFEALFTDGLYWDLARRANELAQKLSVGLVAKGYALLTSTQTNQVFPILPDEVIARLQKDFGFYVWSSEGEGKSTIRLVASWATPDAQVEAFIAAL